MKRLNHGIGFPTAAIELLLPTHGEQLGLRGKIATHWALNPMTRTICQFAKAPGFVPFAGALKILPALVKCH